MNAEIVGERTLTELDFDRLAQLRDARVPCDLSELLVVPCRARVMAVSRMAHFAA